MLLEIGKESYGIDLEKKWSEVVGRLKEKHPGCGLVVLSGLFGKSRQAYCKSIKISGRRV